ncbi:hypothetical protein IT417_00920 [bacterium]|nr:hypothetical protein [bacterium]
MKKILLLLLLFLVTLLPFRTFAQETPVVPGATTNPSFEYFTVRVYTESQSAWNKNVPVFVEFTATIDSNKVEIDWDAPSGVEIIPKYPRFFGVIAGQTYTYKALIKPQASGSYNIAANVIAWQFNTNYTSSGSVLINFTDDLLTDPVSQNYKTGMILKWVVVTGFLALAGYVGYIYAVKSKKRFDKWFNLPD